MRRCGTQPIALQGVNEKSGLQVGFMATAPTMVLYPWPKRPILWKNTSNRGLFSTGVKTSLPQWQFQSPSDLMKNYSSKRCSINCMAEGKDGNATTTTPSDSRDRPPSRRLPTKQASPYRYIEKPRHHMCTDTADIEAFVFASL